MISRCDGNRRQLDGLEDFRPQSSAEVTVQHAGNEFSGDRFVADDHHGTGMRLQFLLRRTVAVWQHRLPIPRLLR